jgi:FkbM family methyltransferase
MISDHFNLYGQWAETQIDLCRSILKPDAIVIEAGSHVGTHTVALSKVLALGEIYAFEPQYRLFGLLSGNLALNSCNNVRAFNKVLLEVEGEVDVESNDFAGPYGSASAVAKNGNGSLRRANGYVRYDRIASTTIDKFVAEKQINRVDLIKIDVEGSEPQLLKGACATIERDRPDILVGAVHPDALEFVGLALFEEDYQVHWLVTPHFVADNHNRSAIAITGYEYSLLLRPNERPVPAGLQRYSGPGDLAEGIAVVTDFRMNETRRHNAH